jgi:hypothetical protein
MYGIVPVQELCWAAAPNCGSASWSDAHAEYSQFIAARMESKNDPSN